MGKLIALTEVMNMIVVSTKSCNKLTLHFTANSEHYKMMHYHCSKAYTNNNMTVILIACVVGIPLFMIKIQQSDRQNCLFMAL